MCRFPQGREAELQITSAFDPLACGACFTPLGYSPLLHKLTVHFMPAQLAVRGVCVKVRQQGARAYAQCVTLYDTVFLTLDFFSGNNVEHVILVAAKDVPA